jgi:hypothetical protein
MSVTATLEPASITTIPGELATFTLRLHNAADAEHVVRLKGVGDLASDMVVQPETIYVAAGETFELPVVVQVRPALLAGPHPVQVEVTVGDDAPTSVDATIAVNETTSYTVALTPPRSNSANAGRHRITVQNNGNVPVSIELAASTFDDTAAVELAAPVLTVDPAKSAKVELRVHPRTKFWNGAPVEHPFSVRVHGSDDVTHELEGTYNQGPRVRPWFVPALIGTVSALVLFTLAWFTLLKPSVENIADDRAAAANEADRAELEGKIAELEAAAAAAKALPLGSPADLRLNVDAQPGTSASESFTVASDRVLSVTDIVFQNPSGAVGRIALLRSGEVLLESELANFRDLDFHFVAPFRFDGSEIVEIRVECTTPGPTAASCAVGATVVGFVDRP